MRFALVMAHGRLVGILTKKDVLQHIATINAVKDQLSDALDSQYHAFIA